MPPPLTLLPHVPALCSPSATSRSRGLQDVDYDGTMAAKLRIARQLFEIEGDALLQVCCRQHTPISLPMFLLMTSVYRHLKCVHALFDCRVVVFDDSLIKCKTSTADH